MDILSIVEVLTQISTLLMMSCGIPPVLEMLKSKNTGKVPYLFFLLSVVNCTCYAYYGVLEKNNTLVFLNSVGLLLNSVYVLAFIYTAGSKLRPLLLFCAVIVYLALLHSYLVRSTDSMKEYASQLGFMACVTCTLTMCTPILEVMDCVSRRSSENISVEILAGTLLCGTMWITYGNMLGDPFLFLPNIPGMITGFMKVAMLYIYPSSRRRAEMILEKKVR